MDDEFVEDEPPSSSGTPIYKEMPDHYGEAWFAYARRALQILGDKGLELLGLRHHEAERITGLDDEFFEDEDPVVGLPDLCGDYELPPLPPPSDESGLH